MTISLSQLHPAFIAGTLGQGGAERQLYYILKALKESGADPCLICLTQGEYWETPIRELGIPVIHAGASPSRSSRLMKIMRILKSLKPDIIQSQHFYTNLYASLAARVIGAREIGAIRNDVTSEVRSNGRLLGNLSLKMPRLLAANSRAAIRTAAGLGVPLSRIFYLPNAVDTELFHPAQQRNDDGGGVKIVSAGRLTEQKRFDRLLRIVDKLRNLTAVEFKVSIYGMGELSQSLEEMAAAMGLQPFVEFRGLASDPREVYEQADIFVLTSDWEGTPNVVLEAMASGLSVVATAVGDIPEIIDHGQSGFVYDRQNEAAMAAKLAELIENRNLRVQTGRTSCKKMEDCYSLQHLPHVLQELYQKVIR
ncbi:MAG: glycosyltransferase [Acidobacteria bacterium]|nr:glycosyltransferase [Acidobacteriota bacterium]